MVYQMVQQEFAVLETDARALGEHIHQHQLQARPLAQRAFELHNRYEANRLVEDNVNRPSFKNWFANLTGVPEGSIYYYVQLGAALKAGLDEAEDGTPMERRDRPPSSRDLRAAGAALLSGAAPSEVRQAMQRGKIRDFEAARRNEGMVSIRLALPAKEVWDEQTERWRGLTGLPHAEAQALMVAATRYMTDEDIKRLAEAGEVVE